MSRLREREQRVRLVLPPDRYRSDETAGIRGLQRTLQERLASAGTGFLNRACKRQGSVGSLFASATYGMWLAAANQTQAAQSVDIPRIYDRTFSSYHLAVTVRPSRNGHFGTYPSEASL